ncbi:MAG: putative lipopolysaccharide heptosyltransferase III [Desulfococcus multivorans]|jgi:predicted lipopolysaccharide heptosyltransferase III|nr:putative lipopolysaccharide heptosyltransferase III [Desulfococcus multivorans]
MAHLFQKTDPISPRQKRKIRDILLIKMRYIGDTVLVTPLIDAIKAHIPHARIHLLVNKSVEDIVVDHPSLYQVHVFDYGRANRSLGYLFRFLRRLIQNRFQLVIDLTRNDRSALITILSGARYRLGYDGAIFPKNLVYTHTVPYYFGQVHTVDHHLSMGELLGFHHASPHPRLPVSADRIGIVMQRLKQAGMRLDAPYAVIHPGARRWYKRWPEERFAEIGDRLFQSLNLQVVLSGGSKDAKTCRRIENLMTAPCVNTAGRLPLADLPALIRQAGILIGNDSSPIHIATAVNTPSVSLFGPTQWEAWRPRRRHDIAIAAVFPCRPCGHSRPDCPHGSDYCMNVITVDRVWAAVKSIIEQLQES